jgi:hypothetical protein
MVDKCQEGCDTGRVCIFSSRGRGRTDVPKIHSCRTSVLEGREDGAVKEVNLVETENQNAEEKPVTTE